MPDRPALVARGCRVAAAAAIAAVALVVAASPAGAHAELLETDPAAGAVLSSPPESVQLRFNEPVEAGFGAVRVFDSDGDRLDQGGVYRPDGDSSAVAIDLPGLEDGSYVVTWRVLSADSHPVQGAFTFALGEQTGGEETGALAERLLAAQGGSTLVGGIYAVIRGLVFASLVLLVGGVWFVLWLWPAGAADRITRRLLVAAWIAAVASTILGIGVQGAYGAGLGPEGIVDWAVIGDVLGTRFGRMWLARLGLLGLLAPLLVVEGRRLAEGRSPRNGAMVALGLGGVAMLATTTLSGHATSGRLVGVAIPTDIVHLTAVSAWLGGLVFLAAGALRSTSDVEGLERLVPRFSRLAFAAVVVIVVSGTLQSWRQLETIDALTGTTYGRLLLTKLAIVGGVLLLAAVSRSWVRRRYGAMAMATANPTGLRVSHNPGHVAHDNPGGAADDNPGGEAHDHPGGRSEQLDADKAPESGHRAGTLSQLRRSVAGEVALAIAVLAVASLLVNAIPGGQALALPYTIEVPMGEDLQADVVVDPATAGPLDVHVYALSPAGMPTPVDDVTVDLRLPERDVGPLRVPLERAGPNHFVAYDFDVPIEGEWEFDVGVRIGEFDAFNEQANVPIR